MAKAGLKPVLPIYSSFLQRAYDNINHDIARMNSHVVIGIDRAGIVGEDGETHHGVFDISFLNSIPNLVICMGKDNEEIRKINYKNAEKVFDSNEMYGLTIYANEYGINLSFYEDSIFAIDKYAELIKDIDI